MMEAYPPLDLESRKTWDALWKDGGQGDAVQLVREVEQEEATERCRWILHGLRQRGLRIRGMSVVEIGCGSAIYSCILARHGADATAVDFSPAALARAGERASAVGVRLRLCQEDVLAFARDHAGRYDLAMSFGTVEHFRTPLREALCRAHGDLVRPGGIVVISVPNLFFLPHEILKFLLRLRGKWFLGYEGSFTPMELRRVGRQLGLEASECHGSDPLADARRYLRIVRGTALWKRMFPWWALRKGEEGRSQPMPPGREPGRIRAAMNRLFGHEITLLGVKPRSNPRFGDRA